MVGPTPPPATGQSLSFQALHDDLTRRGWDCHVADLGPGPRGRESSFARAWEIGRALLQYVYGLFKGHRLVYVTIAQSCRGFVRDLPIIWLASMVNARVVAHLKGGNYDGFYESQPTWLQSLIKLTLRRVDRLLVLGETLCGMFDFDARLQDRVAVVPNGLPFGEGGFPKHLPGPDEPIRLLFLSNLIESKGYLDALEAIRILVRTLGVNVQARFAGEFRTSRDDRLVRSAEHARRIFWKRIDQLGIGENVEYMGTVSGAQKWDLLSKSHFFLLPTDYVNEGQPVSIIEALAYGCVVISTRFRSIPELVEDGESGFLVDYEEPRQIAEKIRELAQDEDRYAEVSRNAVKHFQERFTMERHLQRMTAHLESVG